MVVLFTFEGSPSMLFYLPSSLRPQGCFIYLRGFALKVVLFTFEALPSRLFYLPSRLRPQGCFIYLRGFALKVVLFTFEGSPSMLFYLPSRLRPQGCFIYLRGFALKVVLFTFKASPSRLFYLPSRLRPQGCFIYLRGFTHKVFLFTIEVSPSRLFYLPSRLRPQGCVNFASEALPAVFFWGLYRACWCVDFLSDMACPCPLIIIILFSYFVTIPSLILLFTVLQFLPLFKFSLQSCHLNVPPGFQPLLLNRLWPKAEERPTTSCSGLKHRGCPFGTRSCWGVSGGNCPSSWVAGPACYWGCWWGFVPHV